MPWVLKKLKLSTVFKPQHSCKRQLNYVMKFKVIDNCRKILITATWPCAFVKIL